MTKLPLLLNEIRACRECESHLPLGPRPIVQASTTARILIIGQAPGRRVHESGVPWDDASGARLRSWLGISSATFYDAQEVALVPMGFCYPGTGKSGDLPPRKECRELWHDRLLAHLAKIRLTLLVGSHALRANPKVGRAPLTNTVLRWREFAPGLFPLPHPSPRNNRWLSKNRWFEDELLPRLQEATREALSLAP